MIRHDDLCRMECVNLVEDAHGRPCLIVIESQPRLFRKPARIKRVYTATRESPKGYWHWIELPSKVMVPDVLSYQLDTWLKEWCLEREALP